MTTCKICGAPLESQEAEERGCCDVPEGTSVEEQVNFWLAHDPEQVCVNCAALHCERRLARE
ncbi:MAG TPA: hypothetical protein VK464_01540 [Symbiobacteriaceae bacterium]|jgi:hypothetical protein|nr:hypothetical protein [Symbiobacteriaceae bacterium]